MRAGRRVEVKRRTEEAPKQKLQDENWKNWKRKQSGRFLSLKSATPIRQSSVLVNVMESISTKSDFQVVG